MKPADQSVPWWALVSSGLAPTVLVGGWLIAAALQPAGYHARRQTISALAAHGAADRWVMTVALAVVGICHLVTAAGLRPLPWLARGVLGLAGALSVAVAALPEPAHGSSSAHVLCATVSISLLCGWPALARLRSPSGGPIPRFWAPATVVLLAGLVWLALQTRHGSELGVAERAVTGLQALWPFVVVRAARAGRMAG